jgi:hypothetical protein
VLAPPFRPLPIRAANAVGRGLARVGAHPIALDEATLLRAASRASGGLRDFGGESFRPGLRLLLDSLESDARLNLIGRFFARRQLLELLVQRLRLADHRNHHPELAGQELRRPLFILGLPRTGTTLLYALLAEDPANRTPLSWEVDDPCPPAESASFDSDPRIGRTEARFEQLRRLAPGLQAIHPVGSTMPQECIVLTAPEFMSVRFEMCFDVAGYQKWLVEQDMTPAYRFHRRFLQHLQSRHRAERWVLKSPGHLGPIDALFQVYPDALLVQTHRDPARVVPSVASLEYTLRMVSSDAVDPIRLGRQQLWLWSTLLEQGMDARRRHPEREERIVDLGMGELLRDPIACIHRIYERFDLELRPEALQRMRRYLAKHPRHEFGEHRYSLEAFGLDHAAVGRAFERYRDRFGIEPEPYGTRPASSL